MVSEVTSSGRAEIENVKKDRFSFAISPPPAHAVFKILLNFSNLWSIGQKSLLSDFEKMIYLLSVNYRTECRAFETYHYLCEGKGKVIALKM